MGKTGVSGALEQPARFAYNRFADWYEPERRGRALFQKYHREVRRYTGKQLVKYYGKKQWYAKTLPKKQWTQTSNKKLQKSSQLRWNKSVRSKPRRCYNQWGRFPCDRPNRPYRQRRTNWFSC